MIVLLRTIYFILEILTRYLLMPFAWLSVKIHEFQENTKNKVIYYLILIPHCIVFPITLLWTVLSFWELDIQEKIRYRKKYTNWQ